MHCSVLVVAGVLSLAHASILGGPQNAARHRGLAARQDPLPLDTTTPPTTTSQNAATTPSGSAQNASPATTSAPDTTTNAVTGAPILTTSSSSVFSYSTGKPTMTVSSYAPGESPPIAGAPVLPATFQFSPADWPPQDRVPPTDSVEVEAWMKELEGHDIPALAPTVDGTCGGDPAAAADAANRGWWTCAGQTRDTDIVACPDKLTWGVSFDDGPGAYTPTLLNYLEEKDLSATFFVVGSRVIERPAVLIAEYMGGHEISVHTWSHSKPLTSLTNEEIVAELGWTRKAVKAVLGVTPTTMRPPWGDIDDRVRAISLAMGLVPIMWTRSPSGATFDTNDWMVPGGTVTVDQSIQTFESILGNATLLETGFIVLQHDIHEVTVDMAIHKTLNYAMSFQPSLTLESIGTCVKYPATDLYRESTTNTTFPYPVNANTVDIDGDDVPDVEQASGAAGGNGAVGSTVALEKMSFVIGAVVISVVGVVSAL